MSIIEKLITKLRKWRTDDTILHKLENFRLVALLGMAVSSFPILIGIGYLIDDQGPVLNALGIGVSLYFLSSMVFYLSDRFRATFLSRLKDECPKFETSDDRVSSLISYIPLIGMLYELFSISGATTVSTYRTQMYKAASERLEKAEEEITTSEIRSRLPSVSNPALNHYSDAKRIIERGEKAYHGTPDSVDEVPTINDFTTAYKDAEKAMTFAAEQADLLDAIESIESKHSEKQDSDILQLLEQARTCTAEGNFREARKLTDEARERVIELSSS